MSNGYRLRLLASLSVLLTVAILAGGCSDDDNDHNGDRNSALAGRIEAPDGKLQATIRTTTGGVPHITADNLESAGFGSGYVQARDNVCLIAESIVRARGERARYYGPGPDLSKQAPIGTNVVKDFSYRALQLREKAGEQFDQLSTTSKAMLRGFTAGYNKYVDETDPADLPGKCAPPPAGQPGKSPVVDITPQDLYAYYQLVALYASGDQFTGGPTFFAAPPNVSPAPGPAMPSMQAASGDTPIASRLARIAHTAGPRDLGLKTDFTDLGMGSNGWGIGADMTENSKGALLANPHFPYTGNRRLYQLQMTVPGVYNVNGGTLIGFLIPLIGFNEHVAWTHTVSTAQHFTLYQLQLAEGDNLAYVKDGETRQIDKKTFTIEVANGTPTPTRLQKTFYYADQGPMLAANLITDNLPAWGDTFAGQKSAFAYRDANTDTARQVVDQWLAMGRADNLDQFKQPFERCGSVLWVNTMYADDAGNAFYIDGTSVPNLSQDAQTALRNRIGSNPLLAALANSGLTILDGSTSRDDWVAGDCDGRVAYDDMPKLKRRDFVQNSNDSYWATNPDAFLTGYSPLYGPTRSILSPRTRMGLRMLENPTDAGLSSVKPAGEDGKFTGEEIINMLYSDRAYYAETLLDELRQRCMNIGDDEVTLADSDSRSVADGCSALANWDGTYGVDSRGAQVFRVFIGHYKPGYPGQFTVDFDPKQPATTPSTPRPAPADASEDPMLVALARGLNALDAADIAYDAKFGSVQQQQQSIGVPPADFPGVPSQAAPAGDPIPWPGTQNLEGGFNIVRPDLTPVDDGTRYPRIAPTDTLANTGDLSATPGEGWRVAYGTSWHFGLNFSDDGPKAFGLVSYSQSDDPASAHFSDQDKRFSNGNYRKLLYENADINADPNLTTETINATTTPDSENSGTGDDTSDGSEGAG